MILAWGTAHSTQGQTPPATQNPPANTPELAEADRLSLEIVKLYQAKKYDEALPLAKRALKLRETALGQKHLLVAESLTNLAEIHLATARPAEAEPLFKRALAIYDHNPNSNGLIVGKALDRLAALRAASADFKRAEELYRRAITVKEKAVGPNHAEVAFSKESLADFYRVQQHYPKAISLLEQVVATKERAYGPQHTEVGLALERLACALEKDNQKSKSEQAEARANQILYGEAAKKSEAIFISPAVFECRIINNPRPAFPSALKGRREGQFTILTAVVVDESGNVTSAVFGGGDPAFKESAVQAALKAKFRPLFVAGQATKYRGFIRHTFSVMTSVIMVPGIGRP
jgi:tetratricopeptide (TPR) repeat protein